LHKDNGLRREPRVSLIHVGWTSDIQVKFQDKVNFYEQETEGAS